MAWLPTLPRDRLIVALDVPSLPEAQRLVEVLLPHVGVFKVGLELLTHAGSRDVVRAITGAGGRVFYDGKFDDIPNTVAGAARAAAALGVDLFDVHAGAGPAAIRAAAEHKGRSLLLAVTVLTSIDDDTSRLLYGRPAQQQVLLLSRLARAAGADGVVCSAQELPLLRADPDLVGLMTVVPGIRPAWASPGDQRRVMTPGAAIAQGATAIVVGRPILSPPAAIGGPAQAAARIVDEITAALSARPDPESP